MSEWAVTEEALQAMEIAGSGLDETAAKLKADIDALEAAFLDNEAGLGAHSDSIRDLIEELKEIGNEANIPVKKLVLKLAKSMLLRRKVMDDNPYASVKKR